MLKLKPKTDKSVYLFQGDSISYLKSLSDDSVDLVVTDPPYRTTSRGNSGTSGGMLATKLNMSVRVFNHNDVDIKEWIPECFRILKEGSHFYCMTNHTNLIDMLNCATKSGFHFIKSLVWDKGNKIMGQYYMSQFEYILFFRKGKGVKINNCGTSDILSVPNKKMKNENGNNVHDTEKPVELMQILIENSSKEGQLVIDPFMGIGSTGIACVNSNRKFIGCELDPTYFEIAQQRINEARGVKC